MDMKQAINRVVEGGSLDSAQMRQVMGIIMSGEATEAQIGGFLIGLRMKGETIEEIAAAAEVMRELAVKVETAPDYLVDTCGTGGDGHHTFNISTAAAFVVAAAGGRVAKHGNRSVSSSSGSADVLEQMGVDITLPPERVADCIESVGLGFLFAPAHHGAMKHAIGPRRELGVRTIFNLLGPLTNPACAPNQLLGVYDKTLVEPLAQVSKLLGSRHVMVVHADDGLDEISISSETSVAELVHGEVQTFRLKPESLGFNRAPIDDISVESPEQSMEMIQQVLMNQPGPALDVVLANAGAAIYVSGLEDTLANGIRRAREVVADGSAMNKMNELIEYSRRV